MERYVHLKYLGMENAVQPKKDIIYFNGITRRLFVTKFKEDIEWASDLTFDLDVYFTHNEFKFKEIRFLDEKGNKITLEEFKEEEYDRYYKDLYWWYSRNQDNWMTYSFKMPDQDVYIELEYERDPQRVVLNLNIDEVKDDLVVSDDPKFTSYIQNYEETYNCSMHVFNDNEIYFYDKTDDINIRLVLKKDLDIYLLVNNEKFLPHKKEVLNGNYVYYFGSLEEYEDDEDYNRDKSFDIRLKESEVLIKVVKGK